MPSVDVVSKVDHQALDNAVNNTLREVATRYDFKNVKTEITLNKKDKLIHIVTGDEMKLKAVIEMLKGSCVRLNIDAKSLAPKKMEPTSSGMVKMDVQINEGISADTCKKIVKLIKGTNLKVQPVIQDEQVRVSGKKIDDLQQIMQLLREQDYDVPLQFVNMKRD
ncbi:MAG: YajQ family cyclic di-GMP-binding protein [Dehalococcoidales bacterium]